MGNNQSNFKFLIRADASTAIGTGHVMRCLALAQAAKQNGDRPIFVMADCSRAIADRLNAEGIKAIEIEPQPGSVEDCQKTIEISRKLNIKYLVLDGYQFKTKYQKRIAEAGLNFLFLDDYGHGESYYANWILNQNIYANDSFYKQRSPDTQLLLGTRYALLRCEFWAWRGWRREIAPIARKILVTLGGGDRDNVTLKVIQALQHLDNSDLDVAIVIGGSNPHYSSLEKAARSSKFSIRLLQNITDMPELMAWADLGISAGGSTCWELAFMGLPSLTVILAENQRAIAETLAKEKIAINLGDYRELDLNRMTQAIADLLGSKTKRAQISQRACQLVDGEGSERVLMLLEGEKIRLRSPQDRDCRLLWQWANDPDVRNTSFSSDPIPWEHHVQWWRSHLNNPNSLIYLALDRDDRAIGSIRYLIVENEAVVSINIDRQFRGLGYGTHLIRLGTQKLFLNTTVPIVHAYIKPTNKPSIKAFSKCHFKFKENISYRGQPALCLSLIRQEYFNNIQ
ncbi:UDP-2,4-diacetamido-2,4,6-trideoxy-beta-L-altropyranose hydrolase [Oxynema sp. CENA135]|uniref:UDP-2,4-diacetamido-2,4, 6-trideoxy-beta-L-altropyranose hydrolase n=1 Tax=Oxynema sp. CENA135 TaxID=984206 RepID=UPI00190918F6|nr:UDP-2,4-diacetamido-2,4,6-trideoxy-beta-L-altropyranose hydrolase [Oxynema sp. CENA135]MBK4731005.1 UDP-2,4-diacetamido-2,4,6-trideoxy-beta-L-altropyranose hydrolase [Oxynema sp. CENA135]